jgi:hypothetical protein
MYVCIYVFIYLLFIYLCILYVCVMYIYIHTDIHTYYAYIYIYTVTLYTVFYIEIEIHRIAYNQKEKRILDEERRMTRAQAPELPTTATFLRGIRPSLKTVQMSPTCLRDSKIHQNSSHE